MSADRRALEIMLRITQEGAYANLALKEGLADADSSEAGRITALIYTALEKMGYCDFIIKHYARGRVHSSIRGVLRLALTEMLFMNVPDYAACSRAANLAAEIGKSKLKGFVNGVLRSVARDRASSSLPQLPADFAQRMEIMSGYPAFMIEEYASAYGKDATEKMLMARITGTSIRPVYPHSTDELAEALTARSITFRKSRIVDGAIVVDSFGESIANDELFLSGAFTVQSEGAMLACRCLDPQRGMKVLDACAAPGGKTAYLYDLMERDGSITAWDIHPHRVKLIENTLKRLGIKGVECAVHDASTFEKGEERGFDAILCDVPCSGLGGGSKPDARYRKTDADIEEISRLQYRILNACSARLKEGGELVYSTCTISRRENEEIVERFLREHEDFSLMPLGRYLSEDMRGRGENGMLRLLPYPDNTEGFFVAKLRRKRED